MKHVIVALLFLGLAASAQGGTIHDIRTGVIPAGTVVEITGAVVTAVQAQSFTCTEIPAGPYTAIWVYVGDAPALAAGDVVDIKGLVRDYNDRSEVNLLYPSDATYTKTGTAPVPDIQLTTTQLTADPEAWESHVLTVTDGLIVQELLPDGMWSAISYETGILMIFDDYFFDYATVSVGDCYNNAYGEYQWYHSMWVLKVLSVAPTDCTVPTEPMSFGDVKAMYR